MKNKLVVDFFREISRNFGRFISIFFIVLLGTAFFAGLRSSGSDMRISSDRYYDDTNLMDIKLLDTLGFTGEDLDDFRKIKNVELVEGGYTKDVLLETDKTELVIKLIGLTTRVNNPYLLSGRLPKKLGECLVDVKMAKFVNYKIGDKITVNTDDDDINTKTFTVTGFCYMPYYQEIVRGTTTVGDGSIDAFLVVPKNSFKMKAYTETYVKVKDAEELSTYSSKYEDKIATVKNEFEALENNVNDRRYSSVISEARDKLSKAERKIKKAENKLKDAQIKIDDGKDKVKKAEKEIKDKEADLREAEKKLADGRNKIADARKKIEDGEKKLKEKSKLISDKARKISDGEKKFKDGKKEFRTGKRELEENARKYNEGLEDYEKGLSEYNKNLAKYEAGEKAYQEKYAQYEMAEKAGAASSEVKEALEAERKNLDIAKERLSETKLQLDETKKKLDDGKDALDNGVLLFTDKEKELARIKKDIGRGKRKIKKGLETIAEKKESIKKAKKKLKEKESELFKSSKKVADGREKLKEGKEKLEKNKAELEEAIKKYDEKLPDAQKKINKGRSDIAKAKRDILDIEKPDFYVLDRNKMEGYVNFKQNAERMDSLGNVFPVIFFLVAALVSLTAMTRMVDESRMSMGILKALGFNFAILGKYFVYCLFATVTGSILGIVIGERYLPLLIIKSYGILFTGIPYCFTPINMEQAMLAVLAATLSTVLATLLSAIKQLLESPASLMRPLPPPSGRRVLLERIPFIWNKLNFTAKATVRNLARYKKRLFMTVIGIGGCMGLLLVGFGLGDSIQEIAKKQYVKIFTYTASASINTKASEKEKKDFISAVKEEKMISDSAELELIVVDLVHGKHERNAHLFVPKDKNAIMNFITLKKRNGSEEFKFPTKGAYISEKTAKMLHVKEGDSVEIKRDGKKHSVKIDKIVENYVFHYLFISPETYKEIYGEEPEYNTLYVKHKSSNDDERLGSKLLSYTGCSGITFVDEIEGNIDNMLRVLDLVIFVLIVSAGLLAFVVLYNLNSINVLERKREIATLKVLGFYDGEVASYIYRENIVLTVFGIIFGLVFGMVLHQYVIQTVEVDLMMFGRRISALSYIISSLITFGFSVFVNIVMYFTLKRIDMTTSLKSVE